MKKFILFVLVATLFGGCAAKNAYKVTYEEHNKAFDKKQSYKSYKIKRGDYFLSAREFGAKYKGKKPTILLMHGFPDSQHLYDELIPYLSKHRHVITFDFLGWGDSDKPENHTYNTQSLKEDMQRVIDYFKLKYLDIVVHDASGPVGIDWALAHENMVNTLILLNTYYYPMKRLVPPEAIALFSTPSVKRTITIAVAKNNDNVWQSGMIDQVNKFMANSQKRDEYTKIFAYQALEIREAFLGLNDVLVEETEARKESAASKLGVFKKPVKVIFGDDDPYLNRDVAKEFYALFPNASLHLIKDAKHYVQIDAPKKVAEIILHGK